MKTSELTMSKAQAKAELEKYADATTAEDRLIARAYRAIRDGKRLIDLHDSMRLAGLDELGRPKLAIGRSDWANCHFYYGNGDRNALFMGRPNAWGRQGPRKLVEVPATCLPGLKPDALGLRYVAMAPSIPPKYRPKDLRSYWILWEAEWRRDEAPVDPLLLRHLNGSLYVVMAAWDLTPVERAVLRGSRR